MRWKFSGILASAAVWSAVAVSAAAQQAPQAPLDADDGGDDILLIVKIQAKELKMEVVPDPSVEFPGTHRRTTIWLTDRTNLPEKLEPGVTYRNIGMTLRISSRFENIEEIVREALGETPTAGSTNSIDAPATAAASAPTARPQRPVRRPNKK